MLLFVYSYLQNGFLLCHPGSCQVSWAHVIRLIRPLKSLCRHEPACLASDSSFESPRSTSWTFICACVGLYVFCLNTLEDSRSWIVGRGSVCHSASASKHTCIYRVSGQGHHGWSKECLAKANDHYICYSKVIDIHTYEMLANAN